MKGIIGIVGFVMAFLVAKRAYRYAERERTDIPPFNMGIIGFSITLCIEVLLIIFLDMIGLYPD